MTRLEDTNGGKTPRRLTLIEKLGREERFRTVISGMEPRRIAVVMLLPRTKCLKPRHQGIAWCFVCQYNSLSIALSPCHSFTNRDY
jgi:hypothetical protein